MTSKVHTTLRLWLVVLLALIAPARSLGQDDTAQAREVYAEVNKRLGGMRKVEMKARRPDVSYVSEVSAWSEDGTVRKLKVVDRDDSGDVHTDYYYLKGNLVFVYQAIKGYTPSGKEVTRVEQRHYFRDGRMFKWLGGTDKLAIAPQSREFAEASGSLLRASAAYLQAAERSMRGKREPVPPAR